MPSKARPGESAPVRMDLACLRRQKAGRQIQEGRLSGPRWPDDADKGPGRNGQADLLELRRALSRRRVAEGDVAKRQRLAHRSPRRDSRAGVAHRRCPGQLVVQRQDHVIGGQAVQHLLGALLDDHRRGVHP